MAVWRAASEGMIAPDAILGPPPEEPGGWADSVVDQYSRLTRGTANQVRASFALAALQSHRSLDALFTVEPIDEEPPDLQAARSVLYLVHRALDASILQPVWDCPPRYRRFFEVRPVRFMFDAAIANRRVLKWDHFGGLDKYLALLDYCAHIVGTVAPSAASEPETPSEDQPTLEVPEPEASGVREERPASQAPDASPAPAPAPTSAPINPLSGANPVEPFVAARCELGPDCRTLAGDLYGGYVAWCQENDQPPLSQRSFGMRLTDLGLERKRRGRGKHWWEGVRLAAVAGQELAALYSANGHQG